MHKILYRPIVVISLVLGMLVMLELLALGNITWRNLHRIDKIKQDVIQGHELEQLVFDLFNSPSVVPGTEAVTRQEKAELHQRISNFIAKQQPDDNGTGVLLDKIKPLLLSIEQGNRNDITKVLQLSQDILNLQRLNEERLLNQIYQDSRLEVNFAVFIPVAVLLPAFFFGLLYFRRKILSPLDSLENLLRRLINGEMLPIAEPNNDPVIKPLFTSYNNLISRLAELEAEHLTHTQTLEHEVRSATHALLEQSHTLARSERLAAVGELAASAAHELRNPLAGIQATLENVCRESKDQDIAERLQLASAEIRRLTQRLNELLAFSKQQPESPKPVDVSKLIGDLITLLKYQVNKNIRLTYTVPSNLNAVLPETEFRQALLNLLLNSVQELGSKGGMINLRINQFHNNIIIEISDNGPGFPTSMLEQGIRPFVSYHEHGTGLGLSMVSRFARSLNGQLELKNDNEGHACATLTLPLLT
jgi:signal transduction histidine kinase